jgi:hypothetical protein
MLYTLTVRLPGVYLCSLLADDLNLLSQQLAVHPIACRLLFKLLWTYSIEQQFEHSMVCPPSSWQCTPLRTGCPSHSFNVTHTHTHTYTHTYSHTHTHNTHTHTLERPPRHALHANGPGRKHTPEICRCFSS